MPLSSGTLAYYINSAAPGPEGENVLMLANIGPGGTGTPDTLTPLDSEGTARVFFGDSQGSEAAAHYFRSLGVLSQRTRLWTIGIDGAAFAANTWTLTFGASTTTASGTLWLRLGPHTVAIPLAKGLDESAQAAAAVAAIAAAAIPFTASALLGVVTITSKHTGVSASRITVTLDNYPGEFGVAGSLPSLVNNADATGQPATLSPAHVAEIRKLDGAVYWCQIERGSTWIDDLADELQAGWDQRNNYGHLFQAIATTDQASFTAITGATNYRRASFAAVGDAPEYELSASMSLIATVVRERLTPNALAPGGLKANPGMVNVVVAGLRAGTTMWAEQAIEDAGGIFLAWVNGQVIARRMVSNALKNELAQPDLSEWQLAGMLARREILTRIGLVLGRHLGDTIIDNSQAAGATWTNETALRDEVATEMANLWKERIVLASSEDAAKALVLSVTLSTDVNIANGWLVTLAAPLTTVTDRLTAIAYTS